MTFGLKQNFEKVKTLGNRQQTCTFFTTYISTFTSFFYVKCH